MLRVQGEYSNYFYRIIYKDLLKSVKSLYSYSLKLQDTFVWVLYVTRLQLRVISPYDSYAVTFHMPP